MTEKNQNSLQTGLNTIGWKIATIDDIKSENHHSIAMGPFGSNITKDNFVPEGVPVIRGGNIGDFKFNEDEFVYLSEEKANELKASNAFPKDIVITHRGTLGQVGIIPEKSKYPRYVVSQSQMKLTCNETIVNPFFVFYFLKSKRGQYLLLRNKSQTGVPAIARPTTSLKEIKIPIPSLKEQNSIVDILKSLDDKIELNNQMNKTLEQIVQTLFKHWFIDFEFPDENGNPYKSSGGRMVDSELGEIPEGWEIGVLGDFCEIIMGQSPPGKTYNEDGNGIPFYQGITDFGFRFPSKRVYCTDPKRFAEKEDVLLSVRAPVGSLNIAQEKCAIGRGLSALRLKKDHGGFLYYLLLSTKPKWDIFESEGTVFGSVNKSDIYGFKTVIPSQNLIAKFNKLLKQNEMKIYLNEKENNTLKEIRDSLLPKLMSGKIRCANEDNKCAYRKF